MKDLECKELKIHMDIIYMSKISKKDLLKSNSEVWKNLDLLCFMKPTLEMNV